MNALDRAIEWFSPAAGARRMAARQAIEAVRAYDGAMTGRRTNGWRASGASANRETKGALPRLRNRSRDVVRNTWWGARIKSIVVAETVGTGFTPKFNTGNKSLDRKALQAWKRWSKRCDAEGQLTFSGLLALSVGTIVESGEVLVRLVPVKNAPRGIVPLELQLLEPDHLDGTRDRVATRRAEDPRVVDQGIEYDRNGKRRGYWIYPTHPGNDGFTGRSIRIDAANMLHAYRKDRIGQGRGVPWVAPVMLKGRDVADLEDAVVVKGRIEACLAAFVKTNDQARTLAGNLRNEQGRDGNTHRIEALKPGYIGYLQPGEDVVTVNPSSSMQFEGVLVSQWLTLAAGAGVTYDQLTGDFRHSNFISMRLGKIDLRRQVEQFQCLTVEPMLLDGVMDRFLDVAQDAGILPARAAGYPYEWIAPAHEPLDPLKDMQADILAVRTGRKTWAQFVAEWGIDPDTQLDEIAKWFDSLDKAREGKGISLDCDPRRPNVSPKALSKGDDPKQGNEDDNQD
jgi:lambda family phage portal protein